MTESSAATAMLTGLEDLAETQERVYRDLHQHPELSHQEHRKAQVVSECLQQAGFEVHEGLGSTSMVGVLANGNGPTCCGPTWTHFRCVRRPVCRTRTPSSPRRHERAAAHEVARAIGVSVVEVETHEGDRVAYQADGPDRCFHCKDELFIRIGDEVVSAYALDAVAYGENADDVRRPDRLGAHAATHLKVLRPLADAGLDKAAVGVLARAWHLPLRRRARGPVPSRRGYRTTRRSRRRSSRRSTRPKLRCAGKTPEQVRGIAVALRAHPEVVSLFTRADPDQAAAVLTEPPDARYDCDARLLAWPPGPPAPSGGLVVVLAAGTSYLPVAREAYLTPEFDAVLDRASALGRPPLKVLIAATAAATAAGLVPGAPLPDLTSGAPSGPR